LPAEHRWASLAAAAILQQAFAAAPPPPAAVTALLPKAGLEGPVLAWCAGEFRPGRAQAYAVAVSGRYALVEADGTRFDLSTFKGGPDLSCYTPGKARRLNAAIARSETIQGKIAPRWSTTVVCGFLEDTSATCWQYSPQKRQFVVVGGWTT
jgi:hypothetical protein